MKSLKRLFMRAPKQGKIDPSGEVNDGQLGRLVALDNRLDSSGCQKSKRHQLSHITGRNLIPLRDLANRLYTARDQVLRPPASASDRLEQRKVDPAGCGVAFKHHPHLDTSTPYLHGEQFLEGKMIRRCAASHSRRWQPQL